MCVCVYVRVRVTLITCATLVLLGPATAGDNSLIRTDLEGRDLCVLKCSQRFHTMLNEIEKSASSSCCSYRKFCKNLCQLRLEVDSNVFDDSKVTDSSPLSAAAVLRTALAACRRRKRSLREVAVIARSVGMDLGGLGGEFAVESVSKESSGSRKVIPPKNVRVVSQSPGNDPVSVQVDVAWDPSPSQGTGSTGSGLWWMISWSSEEGALRGNLLTFTSSASLTLLPDTVYHIQVSTLSLGESSSLVVDTHLTPSTQWVATLAPSRVEEGAGLVAAILVFLIVGVLLARRWWIIPSLTMDHNHLYNHNHFKVFPPPVTIEVTPTTVLQAHELRV